MEATRVPSEEGNGRGDALHPTFLASEGTGDALESLELTVWSNRVGPAGGHPIV